MMEQICLTDLAMSALASIIAIYKQYTDILK